MVTHCYSYNDKIVRCYSGSFLRKMVSDFLKIQKNFPEFSTKFSVMQYQIFKNPSTHSSTIICASIDSFSENFVESSENSGNFFEFSENPRKRFFFDTISTSC